MILIGSMAEKLRYDTMSAPSDVDYVGTYGELESFIKENRASLKSYYPINSGKSYVLNFKDNKIMEVEVAWDGSRAAKFTDFVEAQQDNLKWDTKAMSIVCPSLDILYLLKMSHRYLKDSPHFLKTMQDIRRMRGKGARIRLEHQEFYKDRMKDTYTYNHPKLDVSKDSFFDSVVTNVYQKYDHDSIHNAVKIRARPAYTYFQNSGIEVLCDKNMFFGLDEEIRLNAVLEESYVLALERSLIPFPQGKTPKEAFDMALMKVCTSITSGWFREYAWENYYKVQELYDESYVQKFEAGVSSGVVLLN